MHPKISVITAVYNGGKTLEQTIKSVLGQSYKNVEFIIIDGGSSDNTVDIIKKYANQLSYWISEPDKGIYNAWNKGVAQVKGDWVCFLGSDDELLPDALEKYAAFIGDNEKGLEYVSSLILWVDGEGNGLRNYGKPWEWPKFKRVMNVAHVGSLHAKALFDKYGSFDESYKIAGDYELLLRAGEKLKAGFMPEVTARVAVTGVSHSIDQPLAEMARAKHERTGRSQWLCEWDNRRIRTNIKLKRILNSILKSGKT
jgi:glycosyltransferase involved in cell wall biosynthesis